MLWAENLDEQEREHAPDLVVTARPGWCFGTEATPGTTHGYPFSDSMRPTFFVSGPNVRHGARIEEPCRLADLTPTMLDMLGYQLDTGDFDGHALRNIYQPVPNASAGNATAANRTVAHTEEDPDVPQHRAIYWDDLDLKAWRKISYTAMPQYEHMPLTVHHPNSPWDVHNIAYDLLSISDFNALRLFDDAISPLDNGRPVFTKSVEWAEQRLRWSGIPAIRDAEDALDVSTTTIGDYSPMSVGNVKRMDGVIDWVQDRATALDSLVARPLGWENTPGTELLNKAVDRAQWWIWETYRFGQRVAGAFLDEKVLNSIQDGTDKNLNRFRLQPAEIVVPPGMILPDPAPPAPTQIRRRLTRVRQFRRRQPKLRPRLLPQHRRLLRKAVHLLARAVGGEPIGKFAGRHREGEVRKFGWPSPAILRGPPRCATAKTRREAQQRDAEPSDRVPQLETVGVRVDGQTAERGDRLFQLGGRGLSVLVAFAFRAFRVAAIVERHAQKLPQPVPALAGRAFPQQVAIAALDRDHRLRDRRWLPSSLRQRDFRLDTLAKGLTAGDNGAFLAAGRDRHTDRRPQIHQRLIELAGRAEGDRSFGKFPDGVSRGRRIGRLAQCQKSHKDPQRVGLHDRRTAIVGKRGDSPRGVAADSRQIL